MEADPDEFPSVSDARKQYLVPRVGAFAIALAGNSACASVQSLSRSLRYRCFTHKPCRTQGPFGELQETTMEIKSKIHEEAVQINDIPWKPFPDA
jgi:hypothetical protein